MFDYAKFGHMTKQELLLSLKQYEGTGITYVICDPDFDGDDGSYDPKGVAASVCRAPTDTFTESASSGAALPFGVSPAPQPL